MKIFVKVLLCLVVIAVQSHGILAQTSSKYAVRFNNGVLDSTNCVFSTQLEVKALEGMPSFNIADQNYRISFGRNLVDPRITQELELSGTAMVPGSTGFIAHFSPHHLNGGLDTVMSYNVVLEGGSGYPIDDTRWYPVGRIAFTIVNPSCFTLKWHTHDPIHFPPTFIGEKDNEILFELNEGRYENYTYCPPCPNFAPIELAGFEALDQGCSTLLKWETLTETNNEYFSIEKSLDGIRWTSIGVVKGGGTTSDVRSYSFVDESISAYSNYYRLQQVDYDGSFSNSKALNVRSSCYDENIIIGITELFPNPILNDDRVQIKFYTDKTERANIYITDELGRLVKEIPINVSEGLNNLSFEAKSLAAGLYFVQVRGDNWFSIVQKLVKIQK